DVAAVQLDHDDRHLLALAPYAHQGAAVHRVVVVEHTLDLLRKQRALLSPHRVRDAAAIPQPPVLIEPSGIAHAVPHACAVADLGAGVRLRTVEVLLRRYRAVDDDFANIPGGQLVRLRDVLNRAVGDAHHLCLDALHG